MSASAVGSGTVVLWRSVVKEIRADCRPRSASSRCDLVPARRGPEQRDWHPPARDSTLAGRPGRLSDFLTPHAACER